MIEENKLNLEFFEHISKNSSVYLRFNELANYFEEYLLQFFFKEQNVIENIADNFSNMTGKCNVPNIYDEENASETYAILHFLNRYYRFHSVYLELFRHSLFPLNETFKSLDVGSGPAASLFSLSDFFYLVIDYHDKKGINSPLKDDFEFQVIEKSDNFNSNWLHNFNEYVNSQTKKHLWLLPFSRRFDDFTKIDFKALNYDYYNWQIKNIYESYSNGDKYSITKQGDEITVYGKNYIGGHTLVRGKNLFRYDLMTFCYFFTELEQVRLQKKQIKDCAFALKKGGILLIIGASSPTYGKIYDFIRKTTSFRGQCEEVLRLDMSFEDKDRLYAKRIKQSYDFFLTKIKENGFESNIDKKTLEKLYNYIEKPEFKDNMNWTVQVIRKK